MWGEGVRIPPASTKSHFPQWPFPQNMHYTINNKDHKKLIHPTEESLFYVLGAFWVFICPLHKAGVFREALSAHFLFKKNKNPILPVPCWVFKVWVFRFFAVGPPDVLTPPLQMEVPSYSEPSLDDIEPELVELVESECEEECVPTLAHWASPTQVRQ